MCWDYVECTRCGIVYCISVNEDGVDCKEAECCEYCGDEYCGNCVSFGIECPKSQCRIERLRNYGTKIKKVKYGNHPKVSSKTCANCACQVFKFEGKEYYFRNNYQNDQYSVPCECLDCSKRIFYVNFPSFGFKTKDKDCCKSCKQTLTGPEFTFRCRFCKQIYTRKSCDKFRIAHDSIYGLNLVIMKCEEQKHICYQRKICDHASICENGINRYPCENRCESFLKYFDGH